MANPEIKVSDLKDGSKAVRIILKIDPLIMATIDNAAIRESVMATVTGPLDAVLKNLKGDG